MGIGISIQRGSAGILLLNTTWSLTAGCSHISMFINRGYFPKGGGEVRVTVKPVKQLQPVDLTKFGTLLRITGRAFVAGSLPFKVHKSMYSATLSKAWM